MDSVPSARNLVARHPTDAWAARASFGRFRKRPRDARQMLRGQIKVEPATTLATSQRQLGQHSNHLA
ncbi:hypothetical protein PGT21_004516 [Puccinia graminis f. sp. tritici]|uniref:Uncharacterized protein n=1 Tax=Puccinia graminis f. sp. tritici TaxID=56615 RepID=A0A5B0QEA3_PUCGR|nr:hypothetical protein PGT21_004516 [Puccinia graminis f. sp. tritici]